MRGQWRQAFLLFVGAIVPFVFEAGVQCSLLARGSSEPVLKAFAESALWRGRSFGGSLLEIARPQEMPLSGWSRTRPGERVALFLCKEPTPPLRASRVRLPKSLECLWTSRRDISRKAKPFSPRRLSLKAVDGDSASCSSKRRRWLALQHKAAAESSFFPPSLVLPHPELVNGMPYRTLGGELPPESPSTEAASSSARVSAPGMLVSSLCLGTAMIGANIMQDDGDALKMLNVAYEEYGINFLVRHSSKTRRAHLQQRSACPSVSLPVRRAAFSEVSAALSQDVGELDPLPFHPKTHGAGHKGPLRAFLKQHRAALNEEPLPLAPDPKRAAETAEREARRLRISLRLLSGALGEYEYERFALERRRREMAEREAAFTAECAALAAQAAKAPSAGVQERSDAEEAAQRAEKAAAVLRRLNEGHSSRVRWALRSGWWARSSKAPPRLTR